MELTFRSDTSQRKQWMTGMSFSHPAKMVLPLQIWLYENYTRPGDTVLDPMAGSGTALVGCSMGRNVILMELEQKFIRMQLGNWQRIRQRGPMMGCEMGKASMLWGDSREMMRAREHPYTDLWLQYPKLDYATIKALRRKRGLPLLAGRNLEGLLADVVITSPPFGGAEIIDNRNSLNDTNTAHIGCSNLTREQYSKGNIANLPYGNVDAVITSPPYSESVSQGKNGININKICRFGPHSQIVINGNYSDRPDNIGNLKSASYLAAMAEVYAQCYQALKPAGLLILVLKNFIRDRLEVRLDLDTIRLCEQAGFALQERHFRRLTNMSFWQQIYRQKYPDAPVLDHEDILVLRKGEKSDQHHHNAPHRPSQP